MRFPLGNRSAFDKEAANAGKYLRQAEKGLKKGDYTNAAAAYALAISATDRAQGYAKSQKEQDSYRALDQARQSIGLGVATLGVQRGNSTLGFVKETGSDYKALAGKPAAMTKGTLAGNLEKKYHQQHAGDYTRLAGPLLKNAVVTGAMEAELTASITGYLKNANPGNEMIQKMDTAANVQLGQLEKLRAALERKNPSPKLAFGGSPA